MRKKTFMPRGAGLSETDGMETGNLFGRLYISLLVIVWALFPRRRSSGGHEPPLGDGAVLAKADYVTVRTCDVRAYLTDLDRAVNRQGELKLFFPDCLAAAAPFLLFRLKRRGFSDCRALMTTEGLLLTALR